LKRIFRLLSLSQANPLEHLHRRVRDGDFSTALKLATDYGLDTDIVYKEQWKRFPQATADSILNSLQKVTDVWWVLDQCKKKLQTIEDVTSARLLLQHALSLTLKFGCVFRFGGRVANTSRRRKNK